MFGPPFKAGDHEIVALQQYLAQLEVAVAADALKKTLLMFDQFHDVKEKADAGNANAKAVLQSWADAEWFTSKPEVPESLTITVFKVPGETNTDDLSPAPDATTRPDIPLHALAMLKNKRDGAPFQPEEDGKRGPIAFIESLKEKGHLVAYVGDAELGSRVNIGAGTIVANYDGARKNHTTIGDDVHTGSNSVLVAPIVVGAGATIVPGSTVTHSVPAGKLTVARARQETIEGWRRPIKPPK